MKVYLLWYKPMNTKRYALYCVCGSKERALEIAREIVRDGVASEAKVNPEDVWE